MRQACVSLSCLSVRPSAWNDSAPSGRIVLKVDILSSFEICRENSSLIKILSRSIVFRMRNVWSKSCRENQNTHVLCSIPFSENHAVCEIIQKNVVRPERPQIVWRRVACRLNKCTRMQEHARARAPVSTHTHTHSSARTHSPTRAHVHTRICNTYCFSAATMVSRTRLIVTLYVYCLT
jgi:hypothetical protein